MSGEETVRDPMEMAQEMGQEFQRMDLGGAMMYGRSGFFVLFEWDSDDPTTPFDVAFHKALDDLFGELWLDADIIEEQHGEATPETIATETVDQIHELTGVRFDGWSREHFEETLAEKLRGLNAAGGDA